jgi:protein-disulfide isomerase
MEFENREKKEGIDIKKKDEEVIKIPVGGLIKSMRDNPWMPAAIVLGVVLVSVLIISTGGGEKVSIGEEVASGKVLDFLNSQVQGGVVLKSVEEKSGVYEIIVNYQGQDIPVYATLDGENLISDLVPLTAVAGAGNSIGNVEPINVEIGNSPVKGQDDAPVTLVEFSDYQCPFCGKFYSETYPLIIENYVNTGEVKLVFKDYPLDFHPEAQKAAEAARCAGKLLGDDIYFKFHDILFENQVDLSEENYKKWAREIGVDGASFDSCLDSGEFATAVQEDFAYGSQLGVTGTPGFFVNGQRIDGAVPYNVFEQAIESALLEEKV